MARTGRRFPAKPIILGALQLAAVSAGASPTVTPPQTVHVIQAAPSVASHQQARGRSAHVIAPRPQTLYVPRVTFDAATLGAGLSFSHTCTGANRYLTVGLQLGGTSVTGSSVTYAGTQMTLLRRTIATDTVEVWGLANPASGANTVTATLSGANPGNAIGAVSFVNAAQVGQPGQVGSNNGSASPLQSASLWAPYGSMLVDAVVCNKAVTIQTGKQAWNDGAGDAQAYLQSEGAFHNTSWTATAPTWAISAAEILPVGFQAQQPRTTIVEPSASTLGAKLRRRGSILAPRPAALAAPTGAPTVTPTRTVWVIEAQFRRQARWSHVTAPRPSALTNHAILAAGQPKTVTTVDSAALTWLRSQHASHVTAPRPAALTNHAQLSAGLPQTVTVKTTRRPPRQPRPADVLEPRPSGLITAPPPPATAPKTTWVIEAHPPRPARHSSVIAPRPQGLIFTPAVTVTPPKTTFVIQAAPRRKLRFGRVIQPRVVTASVTPPRPVVVDALPQRRKVRGGVLHALRQRFGTGVGPAPTIITTPATGYVTVGDTASMSTGDTGLIVVGNTGTTSVGDTGIPRFSYAPSDVCILGHSNQALGGVVISDVETLIGRRFSGLRNNADVPANWGGIGAHITAYNAGYLVNYRANQVKTAGGWAEVVAGVYDTQLTTFANNILANPTKWNSSNPFIVCFAHEASIDATVLGGVAGTAQDCIDAYRHVRDLFDSLHATVNSKTGVALGGSIKMAYVGWDRMFVGANGVGGPTAGQGINDFDPDLGSSPAPPGTSYYEYIGSDIYNPIDSPGVLRYSPVANVLLEPIRLAAVARNKDIILGEMGCNDAATTQDHLNKAAWLDSLRVYLDGLGVTTPGVCRAMFATVKADASNYNVDSSAESLAAWQRLGFDSYYA